MAIPGLYKMFLYFIKPFEKSFRKKSFQWQLCFSHIFPQIRTLAQKFFLSTKKSVCLVSLIGKQNSRVNQNPVKLIKMGKIQGNLLFFCVCPFDGAWPADFFIVKFVSVKKL